MYLHTLRRTQQIPQPLHTVFPFFSAPENLETITPPWLRMHILTPRPIEMREGAIFDYYVQTRGLKLRWTTVITDFDPPHRFVDVQLLGPYAYWHHVHHFEERNGETIIQDEVRYVPPYGFLGELMHTFFIRRDLERIFDYRQQVIGELFGG